MAKDAPIFERPEPKTQVVTFRMTATERRRLDDAAKQLGFDTPVSLIRVAVNEYVERNAPAKNTGRRRK